jgi:CRP-like cAMP-binding protein
MKANPLSHEAILANHFLLRHLRPDELAKLTASAKMAHYAAGQTIFQKGDAGESLMAVVSGRVKICAFSAEGKELILNIMNPGNLFGELAVLDGKPRSADAVAMEATALLVLERRRLMPFIAGDSEIAGRLIGILCERVRQTSLQLEDALLRDAPGRLAQCLLRLGQSSDIAAAATLRLDIRLSQQQLGNLIGLSRESINKLLSEWSRAGHVSMRSGSIQIENVAFLKQLTEAAL